MYSIQKKTICHDASAILLRAAKERQPLVWDRLGDMQPQCGFGRLGLSCTECFEGPCRINPFSEIEQESVCGRSRADMVAATLLRSVSRGAAGLAALAHEAGAATGKSPLAAMPFGDSLSCADDLNARLEIMAPCILESLAALSGGGEKAVMPAAGMAALEEKNANIVLHGFVPTKTVALLQKAAKAAAAPVAFGGICGAEGFAGVPGIATYGSQELSLLSGKVDAVIIGAQCVSPAFKRLARERGIALVPASSVANDAEAEKAVALAVAALKQRAGKAVPPTGEAMACANGYAFTFAQMRGVLRHGIDTGALTGMAYLGGCGNIAHTQDADLVTLAAALLADGYLVATAGCVGTALARNGLCAADTPVPDAMRAILPQGVPPVFHLGPCSAAGEFIGIAKDCAGAGIPTLAVVAEPVHGKASAIAVALAAGGIPTYFDLELFPWLPENLLDGKLLPLAELTGGRS